MSRMSITTTADSAGFGLFAGFSRACYLIKRSMQIYKGYGLKLLLCLIVRNTGWSYLAFLYRMRLMRLPKQREGYVLREILGSKMYLDLSDEGISRDLIMNGIREDISVEFFETIVKEGDIVVDLGANIGYYALLESKIVGDKGYVYAIEPVPSNVELLRRNIEVNKYSNMEVHQLAIGDTRGTQAMFLSTHRNKPTLREIAGTHKEAFFTEMIDVDVITLDDFMKDKPYPNVIRMDVEGYEYQIIRGMKNILQRKLPLLLFIEFHFHLLKEQESIETLETLKNAGFQRVDVLKRVLPRGQNRHKLLTKVMLSAQSIIAKELQQGPKNCHLNLSIDDILSNPAILKGQWGGMHIFFRRD